MSVPVIKVKIDKKGNVHFDVSGVQGETCVDLTAAMAKAIGQIEEQCPTAEMEVQERPDWINVEE